MLGPGLQGKVEGGKKKQDKATCYPTVRAGRRRVAVLWCV